MSDDSMKPSKLKEHLIKILSDKKYNDLTFLQTVKEKIFEDTITEIIWMRSQKLIGTTSKRGEDDVRTSYNINIFLYLLHSPESCTQVVKNLF